LGRRKYTLNGGGDKYPETTETKKKLEVRDAGEKKKKRK